MYSGLILSLQDRGAAPRSVRVCLAKLDFLFMAGALDLVLPEGER